MLERGRLIIKYIPFRKLGALVTLGVALVLCSVAAITGNDLGKNTADCLTYIVGTTFAVYAASSSYEHAKNIEAATEIREYRELKEELDSLRNCGGTK